MLHLGKALKMPSQVKLYNLPNGWMSKETADGHNAFYHQSLFRPKKWYEQAFDFGGVATNYSDSWTKVRAARLVSPNLLAGTKRVMIWDFASIAASTAADVYVCGKLYIGDRVIGGRNSHGALSTAGGTATGSVGTYGVLADGISLGTVVSAAKFLAATDWDGAGTDVLASTIALGYGFVATADVFIVLVNSVEAFATAGVISGHLDIVRT